MAIVTLTTLRARARQRADMPITGFIADDATGLDAFINEGAQILHEKLVQAYDSEYVEKETSITFSGDTDQAVPSDFYKLYGLELNIAGKIITLRPYMRQERNFYKNYVGPLRNRFRYSLVGGATPGSSKVRVLPAPSSGTTGTLLYAPSIVTMTLGDDAVDFPNGWERYVVLYAAIQCLAKEESSTAELRAELNKMDKDLEAIAMNRNAAMPSRVVDLDMAEEYLEY